MKDDALMVIGWSLVIAGLFTFYMAVQPKPVAFKPMNVIPTSWLVLA